MCNVQHIVTNHTESQISQEQRAPLPSLVDDFTCVHSENALLTNILSTLFSSTSVPFSCPPFGTKSCIMESVDAGCSNNRLTYWKEQGKCTRQKKMGHKHKTIQHFDTKCFHQEQLK